MKSSRIVAIVFLSLSALIALLFLVMGIMLRNTALIFWTSSLLLLVGFGVLMFKPPKYNGFVWRHKLNGDCIELINRPPEPGQTEWRFQYRWFDIILWWPCYLWYEIKEGNEFKMVPYEPEFAGLLTPEELADAIDTECVREYDEAARDFNWRQALKIGVPLMMIGILIFASIMAADMLPKG